MIKNLIKNSSGVSIINVLMVAAAVFGVATATMKMTNTQSKQNQGIIGNVQTLDFINDMHKILALPGVCKATLTEGGSSPTLSNKKELNSGILSGSGAPLYEISGTNTALYNGKVALRKLRLIEYDETAGRQSKRALLELTTDTYLKKDSQSTNFSSYEKSNVISLFLVTEDNEIAACTVMQNDKTLDAVIKACEDLGGVFQDGYCNGVYGSMTTNVANNICSSSPCEFPYGGKDCNNSAQFPTHVDDRGDNYGNWVIKGFDNAGNLKCDCIKDSCPVDPSGICYGLPTGTDKCNECPVGTLKNLTCCPWGPSPSTVCSGVAFTQSNGCDDTRAAVGTDPGTWSGDIASNICVGSTGTRTNSCTGSITINGTKTDGVCYTPPAGPSCSWHREWAGASRCSTGAPSVYVAGCWCGKPDWFYSQKIGDPSCPGGVREYDYRGVCTCSGC